MSGKKSFAGWISHDGYDDHRHHHGDGDRGVVLKGNQGDNALVGGAGRDILIGGKGNDSLIGGAGDDLLYGGDKGKSLDWGWHKCVWWAPRPTDNDFLDGGAGNDKVYGGHGNDVLLYSMAGNLGQGFADIGTHDVYDGGSGFDTLKLQLTHGEFQLASVQEDIAAFEAFLECRANPHGEHGKTFEFKSFNLDARNFEDLDILLVNTAPTANGHADATDEDTALVIESPVLLANDTDPDHLDVIAVTGADATSALGATILVGADGNLSYNPTGALALQQLAEGTSTIDSFSYTIADLAGATSTATVQITVTGVNDAPDAHDDSVTLQIGGGGGQTDDRTITFEGATNAGNVDGYSFAGFSISDMFGQDTPEFPDTWMAYAPVGANNVGGGFDADGAVARVDGQNFAVVSLSIASLFVEPTVTLVGYDNGAPVQGAQIPIVDPDHLNAAYRTIDFGPAWGSIDELRFYGDVDDPLGDYLLIDNLHVSFTDGSAGGGQADPIDIDVLANDTDVDLGDVDDLEVLPFAPFYTPMGAKISLNDDGTIHYDPSGLVIPPPAPGETPHDTFEYTVSDGNGGTDLATVSIALLGADLL